VPPLAAYAGRQVIQLLHGCFELVPSGVVVEFESAMTLNVARAGEQVVGRRRALYRSSKKALMRPPAVDQPATATAGENR
jgi:hypothetical protein